MLIPFLLLLLLLVAKEEGRGNTPLHTLTRTSLLARDSNGVSNSPLEDLKGRSDFAVASH